MVPVAWFRQLFHLYGDEVIMNKDYFGEVSKCIFVFNQTHSVPSFLHPGIQNLSKSSFSAKNTLRKIRRSSLTLNLLQPVLI
jgi:hypothetical protein